MKHDVWFRAMLKDKNIRTIDLAKKLGISQATLNRKIQGKIKFSDKDIAILTEILEMTYEEIFKPDKVNVKPKFDKTKISNVSIDIKVPAMKAYAKMNNATITTTKCDSTATIDGTKINLSTSATKKILDVIQNDDKEVC